MRVCKCERVCGVSACVWLNKIEKTAGIKLQQFLEDRGGTGGDPFPNLCYSSVFSVVLDSTACWDFKLEILVSVMSSAKCAGFDLIS